ncbi:hypothetical protein [Mongoliitalea daihaiensis]|uniref:hypothetical protein n=1 Tax=Mongoliitalea daihaiensis TaxID=2782006 RepID=UPI001F40FE97|nr:hypothetical protein [Mongoliitalea daihaiensis]UJP66760.1 hypothetical protein IPZ59_09310 [Mongoliitalea daihaiensis]
MNEPNMSFVNMILIWVVLLLTRTSFAQDIIWKENGEVLDVFIHKMRLERVVYRLEDDQKAQKFRLRYRDISKVERNNGDIHYYLLGEEISMEPTEDFLLGWSDADFHYKVQPLAQAAVFANMSIFSFASFSYSTLYAAGYSLTYFLSGEPPKDKNLNYPDALLMENEAYAAGYRENAWRIKDRRINAMSGIGIGIGILTSFALILR